jgi:hypothetical protein
MSPHAYTVQSGDTLSAIAQHELGSAGRWPSLCAANGIKNCDLIFPGQRLTLNLARVPARAAERVTRPVKPSRFVGGGTLGYQGLEGLWEAAGGPSWAAPTAACIAEHESGGRQYATGPVGERGYWQINPAAWPPSMATYNPYGNARAAVKISNYGRDWSAWTTAPMCGV